MRILIANEARQGAGGVETYLSSLVPHLESRGHAVALLYANASSETGPTRIVTNDAWSVADLGVDDAMAAARGWHPDVCFSHNMRRLDVERRLAATWPTFKMMHGYFGACVSGHKAFAFPSSQPCARVCGIGCLAYYLPRRCGQLRAGKMLEQYAWARRQQDLFAEYAGIVVASEHMRREYLRYQIPPNDVHTIPLFTVPPAAASAANGSGPLADVVFFGRLTPLKGGEALVRAVAHAARTLGRPVHAVVAGDGPEREGLQQLALELGGDGAFSIEFPGWVNEAARARILARATVAAIPSIWPEPFGLVGLEAAHFGVPSVAFDVGGIQEWLAHDVNGRLVSHDGGATALGEAIAGVLGNPAVHARLSAGARAAAARFSADAHVSRLEQILRRRRQEPSSAA
jgi:glycosyltransferase involved in cell wall biosynthesis